MSIAIAIVFIQIFARSSKELPYINRMVALENYKLIEIHSRGSALPS